MVEPILINHKRKETKMNKKVRKLNLTIIHAGGRTPTVYGGSLPLFALKES